MSSARESGLIRVGFDDQIFEAQHRGGISKYYVELMRRLPDHGIEPVLLARSTRNKHLAESGLVPARAEPGKLRDKVEWASWRLTGHPRTMPRRLPSIDIMHHTFSHPAYLRRWRGPRVVTVYDMTPEVYPGLFPLGNPHFAKRRYCEAADAIIAISQGTADDVARFYGSQIGERIDVVPLAVGEAFFAPGVAPAGLPERYLLYVGVRSGYKDFSVALAAFAEVAAEDPQVAFVVVGGGQFTDEELRAIEETGLADRILPLAPSDAELPEIYRLAAALVFPSRYEGFGLPTLEALAEGTPVILADASCSREVGGAVASYFTPGDAGELALRIREALAPDVSTRVRTDGPAWARTFAWDRVASQTAAIYRRLARTSVR
ncbi:MAG TPA: glycosyltransferase family 1 protein [Microbacteriaceae bacterium]|nr:glycosyltransferase family 1 protein [Microbacteriaceae bacterium]